MRASRFCVIFLFVAFGLAGCAGCDSETTGAQDSPDAGEESGLDTSSPQTDADLDRDAETDPDAGEDLPDIGDVECGVYQALCDDGCRSVSVDPENCGGCDVSCSESEVCSSGQCVDEGECLPGLEACQGSCVDLTWSNDHCGACGDACAPGLGCVEGECVETIQLGDAPEFCVGGGPPIIIDESGECSGDLAEATFRWGACGCEGISMNGPLTVDAYDSALGPYVPGGPGGGVGTNEDVNGNESIDLSGTLRAGGDFGVNESSSVGQRLYVGGRVNVSGGGDLTVGSHAFVVGDIQVQTMNVNGDLNVTASSTLEGDISYQDLQEDEIEIERACTACDGDERIDVGGVVAYRSGVNDNDLIGLSADALSSPSADRLRLELPCGNYYLSEVDRNGPTTIVATGNTALYVSGDIHANNELTITLTPDAQFDLFVAGDVDVGNNFRLGSPNYPALMRLYVGGDAGIGTNDNVQLAGFIYAVPGRFDTNQEVEIFGGLFAMEITTNSTMSIHYDRRIGGMGQSCPDDDPGDDPDPDPVCTSGGGSCETDSDCCTPLTCHENTCSLLTCQPYYAPCAVNSDCCSDLCAATVGGDGVCIVN